MAVAQKSTEPVSSGRLFSRFVGRVAGLPASSLESLCARRTLKVHAGFRDVGQELEELRERLIPALHASIQGLEERQLRRDLLRLKRDVHNRRPLRAERLEKLRDSVAPDLRQGLSRYCEAQGRRQALSEDLRSVFERELTDIRRDFQELVDVEDFRNGLLLSSRTLAGELPRYVRAAPDRPGSKVRQVERSLMRYFSRAAMKTTPFSTFCALVPGTFAETGNGSAVFSGDPFRKRGLLRINKAIYARILEHLLKRPVVRRHVHVELNPTLRDEGGDRWLFLSAAGGREVFQRLPRNPVLEEIRQQLTETTLTLAELIDKLVCHPEIEAEKEAAADYLDRLFDIGFLRFRIGIREQEVNWDRPLAEILDAVDDEHAAALRGLLGTLRAGIDEFSGASSDRRREILDAAEAELKALAERLEIDLLPARQPIFYEDAGGEAELCLDLEDLGEILVEYVGLVSRIAWPRAEQAGMRHFFDDHYGPEHGPVPLLSFYEDYYREHFKGHLEREQQGPSATPSDEDDGCEDETAAAYDLMNPFGLEVVRRISEAGRALSEHIQGLWRSAPEAEEIRLEREDLEAILAAVPEAGDTCRSASLFVQWVPGFGRDREPALVANSSLNGYGKYFSRFLDVLPDEVRLDLIENNRRLSGHELLAEICGDAGFNANLHPPLLPHEISYPTGESGTAEEQIPSPAIEVERDAQDPHRLHLCLAATGEEIIPVDLGFLNPRMRPPLYQLLSRFTPPMYFHLALPDSPAASAEADAATTAADLDGSELRCRPRITYRGRLILARRQWQIPLHAFPRKGHKEIEADYFLRIQDWREVLGLPEEVFLRIQPLPPQPNPGSADRGIRNRDAEDRDVENRDTGKTPPAPRLRDHLYKPQYVDFRNPLLVDLFSRAPQNLERAIFTFEERLPRGDQLLASGDRCCVTELGVQVDFPRAREKTKDV